VHPRRIASLFAAAFLAFAAACGGGAPSGPRATPHGIPGAVAPAAAVEQFLRLAEQKQYLEMGWIFGTREGPVLERMPQGEVEQRMYGLASVLEHDRFAIRDQQPVPGGLGTETQMTVRIHNRTGDVDVPFTAVRGPGDRWFVEKIDVEAVTKLH
jgi:hypothetical protein